MDRRRFLSTVAQTVPALALGETMLRTRLCANTVANFEALSK